MSKKLKEIAATEKAAHKEVEVAKKKLALAEKKEAKLWAEWPKSFRCKKCGLAFKVNELGYKEYEVLRTDMECQYGGEYDIKQIKEREYSACCPVCGKDFKVEAAPTEYLDSTKTYSRWEDKPDFQQPYSKCISKKIEKVDAYMVKHINSRRHEDWV